jgi:DNA repair exonuclease SbcCD nuclease subunit
MKLVALTADNHIHPHGDSLFRLQTCLDCFEWICQESIKKGVKNIIHAGDLFHDRHKINVYAYNQLYNLIKKYNNDLNFYFLLGNHDIYYKESKIISSLNPLQEITNVKIINDPSTLNINGYNIDFIPYSEDIVNLLNSFEKKSDVLISHLSIVGAKTNYIYDIEYFDSFNNKDIQRSNDILNSYKKVFLGHFHIKQFIEPNIQYLGSPLHLSYGDAMTDRGFFILNTENLNVDFIENKISPRYYILPYNEDFSKYDLNNSYLKILIPQSCKSNWIEIKDSITNNYNVLSIDIEPIQDNISSETELIINSVDDFKNDKENLIKDYVNTFDNLNLNKEKLIKIGMEIVLKTNEN